jgi:hypothetical protein
MIFKFLFFLTDCFTLPLESRWNLFLTLSGVDASNIIADSKKWKSWINLSYTENFNTYHRDVEYVDYWVSTKKRTTVGDCLRNYDIAPVYFNKSVFSLLHGK